MKVFFFDHDPGITGSTISLIYLLKGFKSAGIDITVVSPKVGKEAELIKNLGVDFICFDKQLSLDLHFTNKYPFYTLKGAFLIFLLFSRFIKGIVYANKIIKEGKPDLVYINEYVLGQVAISCKLKRIPVVTHIRSPFISGSFGIRRMLLAKMLLTCNNLIIAITQVEADQIKKYSHSLIHKIKIVREFLGEEDFNENIEKNKIFDAYNIPKDKKIILMLGGFDPIKGTLEYINSLKYLLDKHKTEIFFLLIGKIHNYKEFWHYNSNCLNSIIINELSDYMRIIPQVPGVKGFIEIADILVSPLKESHFSRPVIEAWALKKAVITSDIKHAREYVEDEINGMFCKPGDSIDLADKIMFLLQNDTLRYKLGTNGYNKAKQLFSSDKNVSMIIDLCKNIANRKLINLIENY